MTWPSGLFHASDGFFVMSLVLLLVSCDRRDEIVAELAGGGSDSSSTGAASESGSRNDGAARRADLLERRAQVVAELRGLRAKADADRERRDEVGVVQGVHLLGWLWHPPRKHADEVRARRQSTRFFRRPHRPCEGITMDVHCSVGSFALVGDTRPGARFRGHEGGSVGVRGALLKDMCAGTNG